MNSWLPLDDESDYLLSQGDNVATLEAEDMARSRECELTALRAERDALRTRLDEAQKDVRAGWDAFYKLRRSIAEDRYPEMMAKVRSE